MADERFSIDIDVNNIDDVDRLSDSVNSLVSSINRSSSAYRNSSGTVTDFGDSLEFAANSANALSSSTVFFGNIASDVFNNIVDLTKETLNNISNIGTEFEYAYAKVKTLADTTLRSFEDIRSSVLLASNDIGKASSAIADAYYQALSASVSTGDLDTFIAPLNKLAEAGFTSLETAVDGASTIINAYGLSLKETEKIANEFILTQNLGKTTVDELASSIGNVAPTAKGAGVAIEEVFSSLATTTAQGIATSESITGLKATLSAISKPSVEASKYAEELGIQFNNTAMKSKGFGTFLQDLYASVDGDASALYKLFGSVEAVNTVLSLTSEEGAKKYNSSLEQMENAAGTLDEAFSKMSDTVQFKWNQVNETLKNIGIAGFLDVSDELKDLLDYVKDILDDIFDEVEENGISEELRTIIENVITILKNLLYYLSTDGIDTIDSFLNKLVDLTGNLADNTDEVIEFMQVFSKVILAFAEFNIISNAVSKTLFTIYGYVKLGKSIINHIGIDRINSGIVDLRLGLMLLQEKLGTFIAKASAATPILLALGATVATVYAGIQSEFKKYGGTYEGWYDARHITEEQEQELERISSITDEFNRQSKEIKSTGDYYTDAINNAGRYLDLIDSLEEAQGDLFDITMSTNNKLNDLKEEGKGLFDFASKNEIYELSKEIQFELKPTFEFNQAQLERAKRDAADALLSVFSDDQIKRVINDDLGTVFDDTMETLASGVDIMFNKVDAEYQKSLTKLDGVLEKSLSELKEYYKKEVQAKQDSLDDAKYWQELAWEDERTAFKDSLQSKIDANTAYYDKLKEESESYYNEEINKIQEEKDAKIAALKEQEEYYNAEIKNIQEEKDAKLAAIDEQEEYARREKLVSKKEELEAELAKYGEYTSLYTSSERKSYKTLEEQIKEAEDAIKEYDRQKALEAEKKSIESDYEARIASKETEIQKVEAEMEALESDYEARIDKAKTDFDLAMTDIDKLMEQSNAEIEKQNEQALRKFEFNMMQRQRLYNREQEAELQALKDTQAEKEELVNTRYNAMKESIESKRNKDKEDIKKYYEELTSIFDESIDKGIAKWEEFRKRGKFVTDDIIRQMRKLKDINKSYDVSTGFSLNTDTLSEFLGTQSGQAILRDMLGSAYNKTNTDTIIQGNNYNITQNFNTPTVTPDIIQQSTRETFENLPTSNILD